MILPGRWNSWVKPDFRGARLPLITLKTIEHLCRPGRIIARQLEEIGIKVQVDVNQKSVLLEKPPSRSFIFQGQLDRWLSGCGKLPECFLFRKSGTSNYTRYSNLVWSVVKKSLIENNDSIRYVLYRQMDQLMIDDAPMYRLVRSGDPPGQSRSERVWSQWVELVGTQAYTHPIICSDRAGELIFARSRLHGCISIKRDRAKISSPARSEQIIGCVYAWVPTSSTHWLKPLTAGLTRWITWSYQSGTIGRHRSSADPFVDIEHNGCCRYFNQRFLYNRSNRGLLYRV